MKKVLVIEDAEAIRTEIVEIFEFEGFEVFSAKNGQEGIEIAKKKIPDVIVSDILMPKKNGFQVLSELLKKSETSIIPFIFLSAKADKSDIRKGMNLGADDYLTKPINPDDLITAVKNKLKKKEIFDLRGNYYKEQTNKINKAFYILENKNISLIKNLKYAKTLQKSILKYSRTKKLSINNNLFTLSLPRNIVSGDFYWSHENENEIFIAAVDCTGHGISAAFLSVLGVTFLNQLIIEEEISKPSDVLSKLNTKMINSVSNEQNIFIGSGMDIALMKIKKKQGKLEYAGANSPLWITRLGTEEKELIEIKATKIPIGLYPSSEITFNNTCIDLLSGDHLYIFSDGYYDQYGGSKNKKFFPRRLKSLFLDIKELSMSKQKKKIKSIFYKWKGKEDQTDDVLIIGVYIK